MLRSMLLMLVTTSLVFAADSRKDLGSDKSPQTARRGDAMLTAYFAAETAKLAADDPRKLTRDEWEKALPEHRRQLHEMLGLDPLPEKTPLNAVITGKLDLEPFTVEKLHFQSRPGLYVTANLYLPKNLDKPAPAVLYVCGHASNKDPESKLITGNKSAYQHHGAWYASHGYACLIIDTLGLGEIPGQHHGVYSDKRYWWFDRGYTPAGVEAWNCVRALDYLQSRPEVDGNRIGVTGRSGGGAYSWWIASIDERITAAVPTAGITDLTNHVVDGCVEGHCDCMYMVNTYQWDYWKVAALVAPRALLIANSDKDSIFPLDGVERLHWKTRAVYDLYKKPRSLGLNITEGPHLDTQELQVHSYVWMNRFVKKDESKIASLAVPKIPRKDLKVFQDFPADALNPKIDETFVPMAEFKVPENESAWVKQRDAWMKDLREILPGVAGGFVPPSLTKVKSSQVDGIRVTTYDLEVQPTVTLPLYVVERVRVKKPVGVELCVLDQQDWTQFAEVHASQLGLEAKDGKAIAGSIETDRVFVYLAPRGIGPTQWNQDPKKANHIERRFYLLGQTSDFMRVYDTRRAIQAVRTLGFAKNIELNLQGERAMAGVALYASLFEKDIHEVFLYQMPASHREGPHFLNVLRFLDLPAALAMAAERSTVRRQECQVDASYAAEVGTRLGWDAKRVELLKEK